MTKPKLDMDKIAAKLGGERRGPVQAKPGYFGAMQLVADVQARFRTPVTGGRSTDPSWTEKRQVALAPKTLRRLEKLAELLSREGATVAPLQVAALLLERAAAAADETTLDELSGKRAS